MYCIVNLVLQMNAIVVGMRVLHIPHITLKEEYILLLSRDYLQGLGIIFNSIQCYLLYNKY